MDGIHDLGGMHGFGAVPIQSDNYVFRHDWQRRSFGLAQALAGPAGFCADMHRHKIEQIAAIDYLRMDYFEKWAIATSELLKDAGLTNDAELSYGKKAFDIDLRAHPPVSPHALLTAMQAGAAMQFQAEASPAQFAPGDTVRVRSDSPAGHTRVPRYARGKLGTIVDDNGVFQFADTIAAGKGPHPRHCYTVEFTAGSLWGNDAEQAGDRVYLDLAEAYLDRP